MYLFNTVASVECQVPFTFTHRLNTVAVFRPPRFEWSAPFKMYHVPLWPLQSPRAGPGEKSAEPGENVPEKSEKSVNSVNETPNYERGDAADGNVVSVLLPLEALNDDSASGADDSANGASDGAADENAVILLDDAVADHFRTLRSFDPGDAIFALVAPFSSSQRSGSSKPVRIQRLMLAYLQC